MSGVFILACSTDPILVNPDLAGDYFVKCKIWPGCKVGALVGKTRPQDISADISGAQVVISNPDHSVMNTRTLSSSRLLDLFRKKECSNRVIHP